MGIEFNEKQNGKPYFDVNTYLKQNVKEENPMTTIFDANVNSALKDISIFNPQK